MVKARLGGYHLTNGFSKVSSLRGNEEKMRVCGMMVGGGRYCYAWVVDKRFCSRGDGRCSCRVERSEQFFVGGLDKKYEAQTDQTRGRP